MVNDQNITMPGSQNISKSLFYIWENTGKSKHFHQMIK